MTNESDEGEYQDVYDLQDKIQRAWGLNSLWKRDPGTLDQLTEKVKVDFRIARASSLTSKLSSGRLTVAEQTILANIFEFDIDWPEWRDKSQKQHRSKTPGRCDTADDFFSRLTRGRANEPEAKASESLVITTREPRHALKNSKFANASIQSYGSQIDIQAGAYIPLYPRISCDPGAIRKEGVGEIVAGLKEVDLNFWTRRAGETQWQIARLSTLKPDDAASSSKVKSIRQLGDLSAEFFGASYFYFRFSSPNPPIRGVFWDDDNPVAYCTDVRDGDEIKAELTVKPEASFVEFDGAELSTLRRRRLAALCLKLEVEGESESTEIALATQLLKVEKKS